MELATIVNALKSGDDRIALPTPAFLGIVTVAGMLQWKLVLTPCEKVSTRTKQIVSIPMLAIQLLIPIILAGGHRALTVIAGLFLFNTALRCVEAVYVAPALQNREAYIDPKKLHKDMWSCLRRFPLEPKEKGTDKSGGGDTVKDDVRNKNLRPWYRLIPPMLLTMLVANFAASWYATFSGQDAFDIQEKRPGLFFVFFVFAVVVLTFVINGLGYILQLIYVLTYGGGYYDPDEWRLLMSHPILATSYNDFWNYRWHQLFRCIWLAIPFRPVLLLLKNNTNNSNPEKKQQQSSQASLALATLAVFFVSGLMHEYLILCGSGVRAYWNELIGQECLFFTLHGMAVILERAVQPYLKVQTGVLADTLKRIWVIWFAFRTFPLFLNGFAYWELWHANPFNMFTPYFLENVWRKYTILHAFCGSYL